MGKAIKSAGKETIGQGKNRKSSSLRIYFLERNNMNVHRIVEFSVNIKDE